MRDWPDGLYPSGMAQSRNILLTGSSGWLGRHLAPLLIEAGYTPCGFDIAPGPYTNVIGDLAEKSAVPALFAAHRFEGVIHAAALHKPDIVRYPKQTFIDVNVSGTLALLEAASRAKVPFVFTSTTSLMISQRIRDEAGTEAVWLDEDTGPLEPRNIYGATKLAAEVLCREAHLDHGLPVIILRTSRFFPEEDDTIRDVPGPNLKANEFLNRRASVRDMARAHLLSLQKAPEIGFGLYLVSAPTPFRRADVQRLKQDAAGLIRERFSDAEALYHRAGWQLPPSIGRVYDGSRITQELGFTYEMDFAVILDALRRGAPPPLDHDPSYTSPAIGLLPGRSR